MADASSVAAPAPPASPRTDASPEGTGHSSSGSGPAPGGPAGEGAAERPPPRPRGGARPGAGRPRKTHRPGAPPPRTRPQRPRPRAEATAPSPLDGAPRAEGDQPEAEATAPPLLTELPAKELAQLGVHVLGRVAVIVGGMRYGPEVAERLAFSREEAATLTPLLEKGLKSYAVKMDPLTAFALLGAVMVGTKFLAIEAQAQAERKTRGTASA